MSGWLNLDTSSSFNQGCGVESESRPELESVGVDRFAWSWSQSWSDCFRCQSGPSTQFFRRFFSSVDDAVSFRNALQLHHNYSTETSKTPLGR